MNDESVVFAAFITVGGMLATFLLTLIFNACQRKKDSRERFVFEVYPKRLEVYEDVLVFFSSMANREITLNGPPVPASEIFKAIHTLKLLLNRLALYGSAASRKPLEVLLEKIKEIHKHVQTGAEPNKINNFNAYISQASGEFKNLVREETRADFVDKKIAEVLGKIAKRGNLPKKDGNRDEPQGK